MDASKMSKPNTATQTTSSACHDTYDLIIVGGGINGTGIAADAAGRGLKVLLCEKADLASGTSSASSKLIHGGLRYLEHYEFRLVREALAEREVMLAKAPHLVNPLKFTMPHRPHLRPAWLIRLGLFIYDHLSKRNSLPSARTRQFGANSPLKPEITKGFDYYDCWVDDARLVITNAISARQCGASILTRTACTRAHYSEQNELWQIELTGENGQIREVKSRALINAAGPWLNTFLKEAAPNIKPARGIRLIKGSHLITKRIPGNDHAFILQNEDKRIVFAIPYQDDFSLIGTTDKEYQGTLEQIHIDQDETDYILDVVNQHFKHRLTTKDIISSYSGVRSLCDDESDEPSAITRDYTLELTDHAGRGALLCVYGGKITTYRKLAESALDKLAPYFPGMRGKWTAGAVLPGCHTLGMTREDITKQLQIKYPWLHADMVKRFARSYGLLAENFLRGARSLDELGRHFASNMYQREVDYLIDEEWATCAEDILQRRSKQALYFSQEECAALDAYIASRKVNEHGSNMVA